MAKQKEIPGMERPKVQELEDKAEVYERAVKSHKKATDRLKADKQALLDAMVKHKLDTYRTDDGKIFSVQNGAKKIAISEADDGDEEGEDEPEASGKAN